MASSTARAPAFSLREALTPWNIAGTALVGGLTVWLCLLAAIVFIVGLPYYLTPSELRLEHDLHPWFKPSAGVGLVVAIVGTALMVIMLLYSVRKVLGAVEFLGPPTWWLRFHMVCGIMGPVFIILHSGFVFPNGIIAVGFWCMIFVAISGFFGRYLFGHFPRTAASRRLDLQYAEKALTDLRALLVSETRDSDAERIGEALQLARELHDEPRNLAGLLMLDLEVSRRSELVRLHLHKANLPPRVRKKATAILMRQLRMKRSVAGWEVARRMFRYWHLFHQPLAMAMYAIVAWHIFTAIAFGGVLAGLTGGGA